MLYGTIFRHELIQKGNVIRKAERTTVFTDPQAAGRYKLTVNRPRKPKKTRNKSEGSAHTSGCHTRRHHLLFDGICTL